MNLLIILHFLFLQDDLATSATSAAEAATPPWWRSLTRAQLLPCIFVASVDILATGGFSFQSPRAAKGVRSHQESLLARITLIHKTSWFLLK